MDNNLDKLNIDEKLDNPLIEKLRTQRSEGLDTDLTVNCNGKLFECHRNILTTASQFFESKLKSTKSIKTEIEIDWRDVEAFEIILDYFYSGKIEITNDNLKRILEISEYLLINKLKLYCEQFIEQFIKLNNCLKFKEYSEQFKLNNKTLENCLNFINDNLMDVLALEELLELSYKNIELFFTDPATGCDNVPLINLLEIINKWIKKDLNERSVDYEKLLSILDWSNCSKEIFDFLKKDKLFEDNKLLLFVILNTMELNGIDLDDFRSTYSDLNKQYSISQNSKQSQNTKNLNENINTTKSKRNSKRNPQIVITTNSVNFNELPITEEKRTQGKRAIKRTYDSTLWDTSNLSKKKKQSLDDETNKAVYMIKVNTSSDNTKTTCVEKINSFSLINDKSPVVRASTSSSLTSNRQQNSNNNANQTLAIVSIDNDSNQDLDDTEYDIEINSENKELLSMKTEYCVRGKKHSATLAQWKEGVKCPKCSYIGHSAPRLEQHLSKVHQEDTTYSCKYCEFTCKWNREYYKHMKTHFNGPPYICEKCDYTCDRVQFILSHLMRHTNERPFKCDRCDFKSRTKGNLVVHYRIHTGEKPYKCKHCDKRFAMKNTLDQHSATHRDDRPYLCDKCGFTTKYQSHLLSHKRIHTGNVFYCEQENCNYFSPRKSQLAAHMRSHLSIRSHVCPTCGRAFIERSHLIRHERIHLEEKPFKCEQCDYGSTRRDKLKEHVLKHHNQTGEKSFKPKKSKKNEALVKPSTIVRQLQNSSNTLATISPAQQSQQYQIVQQVHFENAEQIPEEVQQQLLAHYSNQQIEPQQVIIGDVAYESQLIVTAIPSSNGNSKNGTNSESSNQQSEIQINVGDNQEEIVSEHMVEFVLTDE